MRGAASRTARSAAGHKPYSRCSATAVCAQASGSISSRPRRTTALCSRRRRRYPWRRRGQGGNRCAEALGCCCSCCGCCCCLHAFTFVLLPCGEAFDGFFQVSIMIPTAGWSTFRGDPWMAYLLVGLCRLRLALVDPRVGDPTWRAPITARTVPHELARHHGPYRWRCGA